MTTESSPFEESLYDHNLADKLKSAGFYPNEYLQLVTHQNRYGQVVGYNESDFHFSKKKYGAGKDTGLSYLYYMVRARRLYRDRERARGKTDEQIQGQIEALYHRKNWIDKSGKVDVWRWLDEYRNAAIARGDYDPPVKRGSHHSKASGWSKGRTSQQQKNRRARNSGQLLREQYDYAKDQLTRPQNLKPEEHARLLDFVRGNEWRYR